MVPVPVHSAGSITTSAAFAGRGAMAPFGLITGGLSAGKTSTDWPSRALTSANAREPSPVAIESVELVCASVLTIVFEFWEICSRPVVFVCAALSNSSQKSAGVVVVPGSFLSVIDCVSCAAASVESVPFVFFAHALRLHRPVSYRP